MLVLGLCEGADLPAKPSGYSILIEEKRYQVRFSTGWSGGGFKFEQLRNEDYEAAICLGITPQRAFAWIVPKKIIFDAEGAILKKDGLTPQHKGKGGSDTAWINVDIQAIPLWMTEYGDSTEHALNGLKSTL